MDKQETNKKGEEMKKLFKALPIVAILASGMVSQPLWADTASDTANLEQRLDSLEQQVNDLKQELQQQKQATAQQAAAPQASSSTTEPTPPTAYVTANAKDGFAIKSADGDYSLKIGGYAQVLGREFDSSDKQDIQTDHGGSTSYDEDSAILLRRVRLILQGTVAGKFDYYLQPDFGYNNNFSAITSTSTSSYAPNLYDAWVDYKQFPDFVIKAGKFKTPFDLENLQDSRYTDFVELGLTSNLSPQRDVGAQVGGNLYYDWVQYAAGVFNGAADHENAYGGTSTAGYENGNATGEGRIFATPFKDTSIDPLKGFGAGFAVSYGKEKGADTPTSYVTTGQSPFFSYTAPTGATGLQNDGPQLRTEPQAYYYYKSLGILVEKVNDSESLEYFNGGHVYRDRPDNKAYDFEATYVLTGENASYSGVTPKYDFDPSAGHWGAFEVAGRWDQLKLDPSIFSENFANLNSSASEATEFAGGLNWYLNKNVKVVFDYAHTSFDRGSEVASGDDGNRKSEDLFLTMLQLNIG
jgi:phosphate-selective porin OprO and OprP